MATMARKEKSASRDRDDLPYVFELRQEAAGDAVERVLARAASAHLAQAIFAAVQQEHPGRRITLRRGESVVSDTAAGAHKTEA